MASITNLSPEDLEFLAKCEEELKYRFTEQDEEFMKVFKAEPSIPPIIENWWVPNNQGRRNDRRHDRRNHPYERRDNRRDDRRDNRRDDRRDNHRDDHRDGRDRRGYSDYNSGYSNHRDRYNDRRSNRNDGPNYC